MPKLQAIRKEEQPSRERGDSHTKRGRGKDTARRKRRGPERYLDMNSSDAGRKTPTVVPAPRLQYCTVE